MTQWPKICAAALMVLLGTVASGAADDEAQQERGPHGGRLLRDGDFAIELTVFELGVPPEFRIYGYQNDAPLTPGSFDASVLLTRLGGIEETFLLVAEKDYRRSMEVVTEPHSFDVTLTARYQGRDFRWAYDSHEGRTEIAQRIAQAAGIAVEPVGPARIVESVTLTGAVQANPANISEVRARFPGVVQRVQRNVGDMVKRGDPLATVESNESLRSFVVEAPINGLIVDRDVQAGQMTADEVLFVIADLDQVWVQLDVFGRDLPRVAVGQDTQISTLDNRVAIGHIDWISPLVSHGSQSVRARVVVDNSAGDFRPGQFVSAKVIVAETDVGSAVKRSGLQTFRDFDVVFTRIDETYEVRMLTLGRRDDVHVEVLGGIQPGALYVTSNSFLVKADIEKSGASHDH